MLEKIIDIDIELLIYLNNLGTTQWDSFWLFVTHKFSFIPLYLLLVFFTFKYFGLKRTIVVLILIALLITASDQTSNLFKYGFERLRPCQNDNVMDLIRIVKSSCGGRFSFFSAHASNTMSIAVFFGLLLKNKIKYFSIFLIIWAIIVGYSRIYLGVHFPLDVAFGFLVGVIYGVIFYFLFNFSGNIFKSEKTVI